MPSEQGSGKFPTHEISGKSTSYQNVRSEPFSFSILKRNSLLYSECVEMLGPSKPMWKCEWRYCSSLGLFPERSRPCLSPAVFPAALGLYFGRLDETESWQHSEHTSHLSVNWEGGMPRSTTGLCIPRQAVIKFKGECVMKHKGYFTNRFIS